MFEAAFDNVSGSTLTVAGALFGIVAALVLGCAVSLTYCKTAKRADAQNFLLTLVMLPAVICVIILLVGSNVARAFSLAGAFSLVRFRSEPGDPRDIAYVCLVMAIGLATGMGLIAYAVLFTVILCGVLFAFHAVVGSSRKATRHLRITIPEDLNYAGAFDEIFLKYTEQHALNRVRTADLGSLFRLDYTVVLKDSSQEKEFLDALRCLNGNLDIALLMA